MNRRRLMISPMIMFFMLITADAAEVKDRLSSPLQEVISKPDGRDGFFRKNPSEADRVVVRCFSSITGDKPDFECTIRSGNTVRILTDALRKSPVRGEVFKKLSPRSSMITVNFFKGQDIIGEAEIYNDELRMPDTSFPHAKNEYADEFVLRVKQAVGMRKKSVATISRLRGEISASGKGLIALGRYTVTSDDTGGIRIRIGGRTKAIVDAEGKISALSKSRDRNSNDAAEIEELIDSAGE